MGTFSQVEPGQKDKADFNSVPKEFFKSPNQFALFSSYQQKTMKAESPHLPESCLDFCKNLFSRPWGIIQRESLAYTKPIQAGDATIRDVFRM